MKAEIILAINFNHDGSAALLGDGRLIGYVNTERYSRRKKHPGLRPPDLDRLLGQASLDIVDVDHVMLCNLHNMDSPDVAVLHGTDLKETWIEFWVNQRNDRVSIEGVERPCTVNMDHHSTHAAAAFFTSPFDSAAVLSVDPGGCRAFLGRGSRLTPLAIDFGWFTSKEAYAFVANELFGTGIVGAGKVMGLAPYGDLSPYDLAELDQVWSYEALCRLAARHPTPIEVGDRTVDATLAALVQAGLERQMTRAVESLHQVAERNGIDSNLCLAGGTALNAVANELAFARSAFERLHLHPASGDDGTPIGAALWRWHHLLDGARLDHTTAELMYGRLDYPKAAIDAAIGGAGRGIEVIGCRDGPAAAAGLIAAGQVVAWFEGASEIGPRALGHRSLLADPRSPSMREHLNTRVKHRERFRPFAPSVLAERADEWFGVADSPFMLRTMKVGSPDVPAVTHVDGTSRIQTVTEESSPRYHQLISRFAELTGVPMVLNTSLNARGEPIVETPSDAMRTLLSSPIDALFFPDRLVRCRSRRPTTEIVETT